MANKYLDERIDTYFWPLGFYFIVHNCVQLVEEKDVDYELLISLVHLGHCSHCLFFNEINVTS